MAFKTNDHPHAKIADEILNELLSRLSDISSLDDNPPSILFHYTDVSGLNGILTSGELWATSALFLNDSSEIEYGAKVLHDVISSIRQPNLQKVAATLLDDIDSRIAGQPRAVPGVSPVYVACFCERDDLLSQWRAYGQAGGYCLGFEVEPWGMRFQPRTVSYTASLAKVEYERARQTQAYRSILDKALKLLSDPICDEALVGWHPQAMIGYSAIRMTLEDVLMDKVCGFKHTAFTVEHEWRLIVRRRYLKLQGNDDGGRTPINIRFRLAGGVPVPFITLAKDAMADRHPLRSIRIGPTLPKDTVASSIELLLNECRYSGVEISGSDIPVRL